MKFFVLSLILCVSFSLQAQVKTGLEVLRENRFNILEGKRVGLITNPTGVDRNLRSTIDIFRSAKQVNLVALYGPEHGVYGDVHAGDKVESGIDQRTGLPIFSLYGATRKPTPEMLNDIDVLVFDVQDVGSRSYTFISTLGLAMQAAAECGKEMVVLDRPNPLGGERVEGCIPREGFVTFVSQYPIPYIHGLTVGELAYFYNQEILPANQKCKLTVVRMNGWERRMTFEDTGLPWVPTSPYIPYPSTCRCYPMTGMTGELFSINIGIGYTLPFNILAAEWIDDPVRLSARLNAHKIQGVKFRPLNFVPFYGSLRGKQVKGVQIHITDPRTAYLTLVQFYFLQECKLMYPDKDPFSSTTADRLTMFDKVCGTDQVRILFSKRYMVDDILPLWEGDIQAYRNRVQKYLLY